MADGSTWGNNGGSGRDDRGGGGRSGRDGGGSGSADTPRGPSPSARRFELVEPQVAAPPTRAASRWFARAPRAAAILLGLLAIASLVLLESPLLRTVLPIALAAAAVALVVRRRPRAARAAPGPSARSLTLDPRGVWLVGADLPAPVEVFELGERFGVVLLSNRRRDRLVAALTARAGTFLVGTTIADEERRDFADLLGRSSVLGCDEGAFDATGPDHRSVCLEPALFRAFLDQLEQVGPGCTGRLVVSDQRGRPVELDGERLVALGSTFELGRPLEWRPLLFQEAFGHAVALYQGTWVRQGPSEVVFVSLLTPTFFEASSRDVGRAGLAELDVLALRDQRLLQASAADPPPKEQRVAIDGLFVVPLRVALDQAPRPSSSASRARHA